MRALSIRQPYAELILRGMKTIEYRTRATSIIGERFYIYAAGKMGTWKTQGQKRKTETRDTRGNDVKVWSKDLQTDGNWVNRGVWMPADAEQLPWMLELARAMNIFPTDLPTGVIVGSAVIEKVTPGTGATQGYYHWHLADIERLKQYKKPIGHPQPMWFNPFN